ncbi:MAG: DUF1611 domain-containing protein [Bacteroidia bacterium]
MIQETAIILTGGQFDHNSAKTAHGLVRGSERFKIVAVIDSKSAGLDAGIVVDGKARQIPVFTSMEYYLAQARELASHCIIGIANAGGKLPEQLFPVMETALRNGMSLVSGMHEFLTDKARFVQLAAENGAKLIDVRKPKKREDLHFWDGSIFKVKVPKIAVLGTDCAVGKRTTALLLRNAARQQGLNSEMIYTGQTGWMVDGRYGFVFDSTLNDFVSGELEHAIVNCYEEEAPDLILIEGQAALRNPSGPCGSEFLVSGNADGVILVHPPGRIYYKGWEKHGRKIPSLQDEIDLIKMYGVPTLGIALNTTGLKLKRAKAYQAQYEAELGIPVALPIEEGVDNILAALS